MQQNSYVTNINDATVRKEAVDFITKFRYYTETAAYSHEPGFKTINLHDKTLKTATISYVSLKQKATAKYV